MPITDPEARRLYDRMWRAQVKERISAQRHARYKARKLADPETHEAKLAERRAWAKANRKIEAERWVKDRAKRRTERNTWKRRYDKGRLSSDPIYKLSLYLRKRLNCALKANSKAGSAVRLLGCSIEQFKERLESLWLDGMTWANYGLWQIDHIVPLAAFNLLDPEQIALACHYTNLQPLWGIDNLRKGQALPEPASDTRRKRGPVVRDGDRASVRSSHGEPPSNVAGAPLLDEAT